MSVDVATRSRLQFKDLINIAGVEFWELDVLPVVPLQPDDQYIRVTDKDRIDQLAVRFYNDPVLWWVIATANGMELLPSDLIPDTVIRIPAPSYVLGPMFANTRPRLDSP